jgi:paired amphipathic helix protein Sin3a
MISPISYFLLSTAIFLARAQLLAVPIERVGGVAQLDEQRPLMDPVGPAIPPPSDPSNERPPPSHTDVMLSDVMGRDRSINIFAGFTRDIEYVSVRLDDPQQNSTVLAPLNSAIEKLPRKPWEDPDDYNLHGASAYDGDDGHERAQRNLRRFVEAHLIPRSPWQEGEKVKAIGDDRDIWWEMRNGIKVVRLILRLSAHDL